MVDYPAPEKLSHADLVPILSRLHLLLEHLPLELPLKPENLSPFSSLVGYQPDPELVEDTGCEAGALNMHLERLFGHTARSTGDGILPILERGPAIRAIHDVLRDHCIRFPENNVLKKWVLDLVMGAEKVYVIYNLPIPSMKDSEIVTNPKKRPRSETISDEIDSPPQKAKKNTTASQVGRPANALLKLLVIDHPTKKGRHVCVAHKTCADKGWSGNRQTNRILKHATKCEALKTQHRDAWEAAIAKSGDSSLGSQLESFASASASTSSRTQADIPQFTFKLEVPNASTAPVTPQGTLNLAPLRAAGKKEKAARDKEFQSSVDHIIMRLICVRGLVPNILDSPEWKELMAKLNGTYKPTSSNIFRNSIIPSEAIYIQNNVIKRLQDDDNLTLTFDGTSIRSNESFYTAHATTPSRDSYFLDAHEGSGVSHNQEWITKNMMKTIEAVGVDRWAAVVSDNTNVTKAARRNIIGIVPAMLDLWDCVHHLQNTIKDITKLSTFKSLITVLKGIIKYFSKSSFGTAKLREVRAIGDSDGPVNALQKIGKTRFGTYWLAATSLDPCLPFIRDLVMAKTIKFKNTHVQGIFGNKISRKYVEFNDDLLRYTNIVAPFIRSLWSLEAAHANAADVFVFWLAIAATLKDLFDQDENKTGIPRSLANEVTEIYNRRYAEFFKSDIYFVAFILDPRYPMEDYLKLTINLPASASTGTSIQPTTSTSKYPRAYERLRLYLRSMIEPMLKRIQSSTNPTVGNRVLREKGIANSVSALKREIENFWNSEYPFRVTDPQTIQDPLAWWRNLGKLEGAEVLSVLAIRIFSTLVNSMPDERTNSTITWLNSPTRGNQQAGNLVDIIKVGQWYGRHDSKGTPNKVPRYRPAVKFRKIDKATLERLQTGGLPTDSDSVPASESEKSVVKDGFPKAELVNEIEESDSDDENGEQDNVGGSGESGEEKRADGNTEKIAFTIDGQIDINSRALVDMISEEAVVAEKPLPLPSARQTTLSTQESHKSVEEAFEGW